MRDDQASGLRRLFAPRGARALGVGGAQTSAVCCELAEVLAERGRHVLLIDRSRGEAAARFGARARYELADALAGDLALADVLLHPRERLALLPAARGLDELALDGCGAGRGWQAALGARLATLGVEADLWLVNGLPPAGSDADVLLAIQPTAAAVTGAYAQVKALATLRGQRAFGVVVDRARSDTAAHAAFAGLAATARRFLSAELRYRGHVPGGAARRQAFLHLAHALAQG